ncbi:MAG: hypothetical protein CL623_04775 [Arcobacter sp.]|nr:hypothetical protein [Arcobacter sp.]|tara:strand:+ start:21872 stop:23365 length:1494 start_codon:yes stop_codon:yes gene_type:complete
MKSVPQIEEWLNKFSINNYIISDDLEVSVFGNVNLNGKLDGKKIPIKFKSIDGYFDISNNSLTSLEGSPDSVLKDFNCSNNILESLFGAPYKVGDFDCSKNELTSLSYCPKEVDGFFDCSDNKIISVKGAPRTVKGHFKCSNNKITSLKGGAKYIDTYFDCSDNLIEDLTGGPITVGHDYICNNNKLTDLENISDEIGWDLITDIRLNHVTSSHDEEKNVWRYKGSEVVAHIYKPLVELSNIDDINRWLKKHGVTNFHILKDNSVDVNGDVHLADKLSNLIKLPLKFNIVDGNFDISDNELVSLEGSPSKVTGNFHCFKNEISSLKGSPKEVGGSFIVLKNNISSLKYSPSIVKEDYVCSHNPIKDLEGLKTVHGAVFTGVKLDQIKNHKYVYKSVVTYKYPGAAVMSYLDKAYISLTDEEKKHEATRMNLNNAIKKMVDDGSLTKEKITDTLILNLTKYNLNELKDKVLKIKNPPVEKKTELTEEDILALAFDSEL